MLNYDAWLERFKGGEGGKGGGGQRFKNLGESDYITCERSLTFPLGI